MKKILKMIIAMLLVLSVSSLLGCTKSSDCISVDSEKSAKISEILRQDGYEVSAMAFINHTTVYDQKSKILYIYVKDDMELVNKLISDRARIEKIAELIIENGVKFKISYHSDNLTKDF